MALLSVFGVVVVDDAFAAVVVFLFCVVFNERRANIGILFF